MVAAAAVAATGLAFGRAGPRFSVVVPAHNEAGVLGRTLGSLRAQDFAGPVEVVVIDDGSVDGTADLARAVGVRVEEEPMLGVVRPAGAAPTSRAGRSSSPRTPSPCPPDWLSRIDTAFRDDPDLVAVAGSCRYEDAPGWAAVFPRLGFAGVAAAPSLTGRVGHVTATNVAFRREGFAGHDTSLTQGGDEVDLLRRLRRRGRVTWDARNAVRTSSRRVDQGWRTPCSCRTGTTTPRATS